MIQATTNAIVIANVRRIVEEIDFILFSFVTCVLHLKLIILVAIFSEYLLLDYYISLNLVVLGMESTSVFVELYSN